MAIKLKKSLPVEKNQELDVKIEDLSFEGMGVAKIDGYPLFIDNALPGEEGRVHVLQTKSHYGYGKWVNRTKDAPNRVPLLDEAGTQTGTMALQHMTYDSQLAFKTHQIEVQLQREHLLENVTVHPMEGLENPLKYRNKGQIPISGKPGELFSGFYRKGSHKILPVKDFHIQLPGMDERIQDILSILNRYQLSSYNETTGKGLLRHVVVRMGYHKDQTMVILVVNSDHLPHQKEIVAELVQTIPNLVSVVLSENTKRTNVIMGQKQHVLYGKDYYKDEMNGLEFKISSKSFFQVNTPQAERIYSKAIALANLKGNEIVVDAYCGIGTLSLHLAQEAKKVYGVEIVPDAIEMAKQNAEMNNITNTEFVAGKAEEVMPKWVEEGIQPDLVVVDPPRKGLARSFIESVLEVSPDRIVYVSCNPNTLARDLRLFVDNGYTFTDIYPFDMFPQTPHIECAVLLSRVK